MSRAFFRPLARFAAIAALAFAALWTAPASAAVNISVNLATQRMTVTNGKGETFNWAISSGRMGYVTPRGSYRPQSLARMHYSRKYGMAPMPHSIFFHKGWAIHGTSAVGALGRPASHGCIRLAPGNAAKLFAMVQKEGAVININGQPPHMMNVAKGKSKTQFAHKTGKKKVYVASAGAKKKTYIATHRRAAEPMAFAPVQRAPGIKAWQQRPVR